MLVHVRLRWLWSHHREYRGSVEKDLNAEAAEAAEAAEVSHFCFSPPRSSANSAFKTCACSVPSVVKNSLVLPSA